MWKIQSKIFMLVCLFVLFFGHNVLAQEQVVTPNPVGQTADADQPVSIDVIYSTANPPDITLTGLGLRIHWDSSKLTFSSLTSVLSFSLVTAGIPEPDTLDYDSDANTDMFVNVAWADMAGNWPGVVTVLLYTANFTTATDFSGSTQINFSASSTAVGRTLDPTSATITKTATPGTLEFSSATYSVNEGGGTATITVTRTGGNTGAVSVDYATSDGTATSGVDYTSASGTLNWADGDSASKTFNVSITQDVSVESDETVNLTLSNPGGGAVLGTNTAVLTILDDDSPGTLQFSSATYSVNEGGGTATITVPRTGGSGGAVSVDYATSDGTATAGVDYTSASGTLNWADGDSASKTFNVSITQDVSVESDETVNLTLSNPGGGAVLGTNTAVLTILDDDSPGTLQFSSATYSVNEGGGTATITVPRTGGSTGAVSVDYATSDGTATSGVDYTTTSGTLNWADGDSASKTFNIPIIDDSDIEGSETVNLSLSNPTGGAILGTNAAVLTIADNDGAAVTVPTMTEWGMIVLVLLIGLSSAYYLKRKQTI